MSGRTFAQIKVSTWIDDDFLALPMAAKMLYFAMVSNPTLNYVGVGDWNRQDFIDYNPDWEGEVVDEALEVLIERRYVVLDQVRSKYVIRAYLRSNRHLLNNARNAAGIVNVYTQMFSLMVRHVLLHELHRLREEEPTLKGWEKLESLFADAKFDYKIAPASPIRSGVPTGTTSQIASGVTSGATSLIGHPMPSPIRSPVRPISRSIDDRSIDGRGPANADASVADAPAPATKSSTTKKRKTSIPANFEPTDNHRAKAAENDLDLDAEVEKFVDYWTAEGKQYVDWNAAFNNWLRKAVEFKKRDQATAPQSAPAAHLRDVNEIESPPSGLTDEQYEAWRREKPGRR